MAQTDTFVADEDSGTSNESLDLTLMFAAEGASGIAFSALR